MPKDIVLLGGPGAGKGTQAQILQSRFGYRQISTGDLLREHRNRGTDLGKAAQGFMQRGELVPDELIIRMVEGELRDDAGVLFDGFPRTVAQAEALDALLEARGRGKAQAVYFAIDRPLLEERLAGRWTNPRTGRVYHATFNPPKAAGICDDDGGPLIQRDDDKPETVKKRLDVFETQTMPLVDYYGRSHRLSQIDATQSVETVAHELLHAIGAEHPHDAGIH
ncbi:MAG TPA: adenylate kinase [Candidatus Baltobacteraceae bacterium]|nr:adenylate kinase [Candidatus Baltobacteraceae bacterium]